MLKRDLSSPADQNGGQPGSSQSGRRPVIFRDATQRAMLHKIRDSLSHLQKNPSATSPGSDTSGASGTSTPSKDIQGKDSVARRNDNYHSTALEVIRRSLQTYKKDEPSTLDIEADEMEQVDVRELIQKISSNEQRNGVNTSKFGGLVGPRAHSHKAINNQEESRLRSDTTASEGTLSNPPPLPPRTRGSSTPPPPLPPRDSLGCILPSRDGAGGISRASVQYQPLRRAGPAPSAATPPSTLEQLAAQTGLTTDQIWEMLQQHEPNAQRQQEYDCSNTTLAHSNSITSQSDSAPIVQYTVSGAVNNETMTYPAVIVDGQYPEQYMTTSPQYMVPSNQHIATPPPPPPPPYQPSPASSVTSSSSNDYLLLNSSPWHGPAPTAYADTASSGSSSPASIHGYPQYYANHPIHHGGIIPNPISVWEAKQQPIITHSARSEMVSRPHMQTATAPHSIDNLPPNYTAVTSRRPQRTVAKPPSGGGSGGIGGGNVHIKLRHHQDPQLQVTGYPSFQVTARNAQVPSRHVQYPNDLRPSIQIQFGAGTPSMPVYENHTTPMRRKDSLETRSDSPVSRTTNQSPLSMVSTTSTNSDVPDRPPPPYPGNSRQVTAAPELSESSEQEQCESEDGDNRATHRCTSPIPERRADMKKKDDERRWTNVRHYSPAAFKFYMEQHIENVLKQHKERVSRRIQLEREMSKVALSEEARDQMRRMLHKKESNYIRLKRAKMNRSMFDVVKKLGVGAFGEVSLVRKKINQQEETTHSSPPLYAMKTLRKVDVIRRNQVAHVKAERDILAEAELEWVVKLYYSFQDKENLYFIMEYIPGGDLMALLIKKGIFEESLAMFYIAELVLAIDSVHKMGFIHRDIKPDNVLIDKDGHIKLTDFGLCTGFRWTHNNKYYQEGGHSRQDSMDPEEMINGCQCPKELPKILEKRKRKEKQRCQAHSLVGTPNYIAPEVLLRAGYTKTCDWWSVGVILYEMLVGQPPFLANTPRETQIKVVNWKTNLHIPEESNLSRPAIDLIMCLCCGAENRLGAKSGAEEIKCHNFFKPIKFDDLRKQRAPYKPTIRYPTDTSNFDECEEQEPCYERVDDLRQNGSYPEHAFSEFTFRRFFDDGGHAKPLNITESLSHGMRGVTLAGANQTHSHNNSNHTEERTPQNSYHDDEDSSRCSGGNPVYV